MRTAITRAAGNLVVVVSVTGIVFVTGMRARSPAVVNGVRKLGRAMRPLALKSAGRPGASASCGPPRRTDIGPFLFDAGGGGADR